MTIKNILYSLPLFCSLAFVQGCNEQKADLTKLPYLADKGKGMQMFVDDRPFTMLTGELHNSTSTSESYMEEISVWEQMKNANFNTVIASCSWDIIEKEEGKYDFSSVDHVIRNARENGLKVVMIWFASWKNGNSTYAPGYIKRNPERFPLVKDDSGRTLNVLSTFGEESMKADRRAFAALMKHIKETDPDHTVIMMQVENEMGILGSKRDFSSAAQRAWEGQVPQDLTSYLVEHKGKLFPELEKVWAENGYRTSGTWTEVFGEGRPDTGNWLEYPFYTEEIFQAYHYAKYVGAIAEAGREELNLPMYVNNWLRQPGMGAPGQFPSGSPLPEVLDIWRAGAPSIDFTAPDIYINEYEWVLEQFSLSGNPIFIPECRGDVSKALYAFGEYDALGFAPFGFDGPHNGGFGVSSEDFANLGKCYGILAGMDRIIPEYHGSERMRGLFITEDNLEQSIEMGDYVLTARSSVRNMRSFNYGQGAAQLAAENAALAAANRQGTQSGALVIQVSENEFYIVGINVSFSFALKDKDAKGSVQTELIEEGTFVDNSWTSGRNLNGDENRVSITGVGAERVILYKSSVDASARRF